MTPGSLRPIAVNLLALIVLGFVICAWVLHYTDVFPEVLSLLTLGGLFAWLAFLANLLTDDRKKELQARFEERVLQPRRTFFWISALLVLFLGVWAPSWGSLVVSTKREDKDRTVEIRSLDAKRNRTEIHLEAEHLPPRSERKYPLRTSWLGSRTYQVKVSGLPARDVRVTAFRRKPLSVPGDLRSFERPLLLVHLSEVLNASIQRPRKGGRLLVTSKGAKLGELYPYHGEAVWVGGDEDIEIPPPTLMRWSVDLAKDNVPSEALARWEPRRSIAPNVDLSLGQRLEVIFENANGGRLALPIVVTPPFPQEVNVDEPHSN